MKLMPGVFAARKKNGAVYYRSSITFHSKHISLGSFDTESGAHEAYLDALNLIKSGEPLVPEDYSKKICKALSFKKWVALTNFKNNGIYIKTPIYLKNTFFYYYISQNDVLIFDADDLFYYSNHSIMRRGGHLFVAEYGMQTNIASRYGIRGFARPGTDFIFVNGDCRDFRYENIKVFNAYQGVTVEKNGGLPDYAARIHVNGNILVGRYPSLIQAAVAYNKAADALGARGVKKSFKKNYIEELSADEYMKIYDEIEISEKISKF